MPGVQVEPMMATGVALCTDHQNKASPQLLEWLSDSRIKFAVNIVMSNILQDRPSIQNVSPESTSNIDQKTNKNTVYGAKSITRDMLQNGEASQMMSADE